MNSRNLILLIVDDSLIINARLTDILEDTDNLGAILHAGSFEEGMQVIGKTPPDIILLDINLPDESGIQLLRIIKEEFPAIKVIMITNHADEHHRSLCKLLGAHYFFDKTNDFNKLPEIIANIQFN